MQKAFYSSSLSDPFFHCVFIYYENIILPMNKPKDNIYSGFKKVKHLNNSETNTYHVHMSPGASVT